LLTKDAEELTDIKPNNILISYTLGPEGVREIDRVAIADTEDAAKVKKDEGIFVQVGNVLWRSPEAQIGIRVGKASDIWSFGATVSETPPPILSTDPHTLYTLCDNFSEHRPSDFHRLFMA
jgi:serine/threonine protein kinase